MLKSRLTPSKPYVNLTRATMKKICFREEQTAIMPKMTLVMKR